MEYVSWFPLQLIVKCEKKDKWKEILSEKESALNDFENYQPTSDKKMESVLRKEHQGHSQTTFATEIRHVNVTHGSNQPFQKNPGIQMDLSRKDLWRI